MKKYIQSFRLFFGTCQIKSMTIFAVIIAVLTALCGLSKLIPANDFLIGFAQGVSSMMGAMCAVFGLIFLNSLYQYMSPVNPGFKYYASLPDGASHFRRAIVIGNLLGIITGLVLLAIICALYLMIGVDVGIILFGISLLFLSTGVCNLTGFIKNNTVRVVSLMSVLCLFGFTVGFVSGSDEKNETTMLQFFSENYGIALLIGGISIAAFITGLAYALAVAEKKWGEAL